MDKFPLSIFAQYSQIFILEIIPLKSNQLI